MKQSAYFKLVTLNGESYLFPFGQALMSSPVSVKLDEGGVFLWDALSKDITLSDLQSRFFSFVHADEEERDQVNSDVETFINNLRMRSMIVDYPNDLSILKASFLTVPEIHGRELFPMLIAATGIEIRKDDSISEKLLNLIPKEFLTFKSIRHHFDYHIQILPKNPNINLSDGSTVFEDWELRIVRFTNGFRIFYKEYHHFKIVEATDSVLTIYQEPVPVNGDYAKIQQELSRICRAGVYLKLEKKQIYSLHSASVDIDGTSAGTGAILFTAKSGTGKSTQAGIMNQTFGSTMINGDCNLISLKNNKAIVMGQPWCGTSEIYDLKEHKLTAVVKLVRTKEKEIPSVQKLNKSEAAVTILQRIISPLWTKEQLQDAARWAEEFSKTTTVFRMKCDLTDRGIRQLMEHL